MSRPRRGRARAGNSRRSGRSHKGRDRPGRVVETVGRRVRVRDSEGERVCFLSGQRAVIGDRVRWVVAKGTGGKLVGVEERQTVLSRLDHKGREQIVAANLQGVIIVDTGAAPPLAPVLLDRYLVAADRGGLQAVICINKADLGLPEDAREQLAVREAALGIQVLHTSAATGQGVAELRRFVAESGGAWALVGRSGVGKTSLVQRLLPDTPDDEIGETAELSEYWGMGKHTTTSSRIFELPDGGEIVDSPGIRNFTPAGLTTEDLRLHFPSVREVRCQFRDCLHREGEEGCAVPDAVHPALVHSYRTLLKELLEIEAGVRRGRGEQEKKRS